MTRRKQAGDRPWVWLDVPPATGWGRDVLRGAFKQARLRTPWHLDSTGMHQKDLEDGTTRFSTLLASGDAGAQGRGLPFAGVIGRIFADEAATALTRLRVPVVNVSNAILGREYFPRVAIDLDACAALAADHLKRPGIASFAYVGVQGDRNGPLQHAAFARSLGLPTSAVPAFEMQDEPHHYEQVIRFVELLPKPLGIFVRFYAPAHMLLRILACAGYHVPESVIVLSGDDDPLFAETGFPTLSAIDVGAERIGAKAVDVLASMLAGRPAPRKPIFVKPVGVIARGSTDIVTASNADLVHLIRFIRGNLQRPIRIEDLMREAKVSRRMLFKMFHEELGRSPHQEICRMRLAHAQSLLASEELSLEQIAHRSGFANASYMARVFARELGQPPTAFRRSRL